MLSLAPKNTIVTTAGNGTLLAAAILGTFIQRSGPAGNFTDTFDSTANIIAALGPAGGFNGSFVLSYNNTTANVATLAAGDASTTLTGSVAVPANSVAEILFTVNAAAGTITAVVLYRNATN